MTRHDPWVRVRHMRDYAQEAIGLLGEKTLDDLPLLVSQLDAILPPVVTDEGE